MTAESRRILIADDHAGVRNGIRSLLAPWPQMRVVAEARTGAEAVDAARSGLQGIDLILALKRELPEARIVIYTMHRSEKLVREALRAGASSYVVKGDSSCDLLDALMKG